MNPFEIWLKMLFPVKQPPYDFGITFVNDMLNGLYEP